ncbi:hypothetical protein [Gemmatimonas groenlandica]|uniref:histidine kinase n=1 Tax=Gemmatimonas groenlandica TaxID=2732249 RepID=A0A6M4ISZ4_9BACT|nr:hypothetical protein [Gemmatimonas groenlandica]QJR35942.1 hypothetical protein HKW67_10705 [Gemmatimonas groenlandica]
MTIADEGLGHELRNLVMPILLRLDVLRATEPLSPKAQVDIGVIRDMVLRLERLAAGLDGPESQMAPLDNMTASVPGVRVRLLMDDPRQVAVARMLLSQWGWSETEPSEAAGADLLLCDAEHFDGQSEQATWLRSLETAGCRVVVLGSSDGQPARANVSWLESRDLPKLGALLR